MTLFHKIAGITRIVTVITTIIIALTTVIAGIVGENYSKQSGKANI